MSPTVTYHSCFACCSLYFITNYRALCVVSSVLTVKCLGTEKSSSMQKRLKQHAKLTSSHFELSNITFRKLHHGPKGIESLKFNFLF